MNVTAFALIVLIMASPAIAFLIIWEIGERREQESPQVIGFWEMQKGKTYRVELFGEEWITDKFEEYQGDRAVFENEYIYSRVTDQVRVTEVKV